MTIKLTKQEYKELTAQLKVEALNLELEETKHILCPVCLNRNLQRQMSITRIFDGFLFHCFSASCGVSGFVSSSKQLYQEKPRKKKFKPRILTRPLQALSENLIDWLTKTYHLDRDILREHRWKHDYLANRLAIPIYNADGRRVAWTCKALEKQNTPKSIEYWEHDYSHKLNIPLRATRSRKTVLVEDSISMLRLLPFVNSIALLGTHMPYGTALLLSKIAPRIVVALDADTWQGREVPLGIKLRDKFCLMFESFEVLRITKDPKDMDNTEFNFEILDKI